MSDNRLLTARNRAPGVSPHTSPNLTCIRNLQNRCPNATFAQPTGRTDVLCCLSRNWRKPPFGLHLWVTQDGGVSNGETAEEFQWDREDGQTAGRVPSAGNPGRRDEGSRNPLLQQMLRENASDSPSRCYPHPRGHRCNPPKGRPAVSGPLAARTLVDSRRETDKLRPKAPGGGTVALRFPDSSMVERAAVNR